MEIDCNLTEQGVCVIALNGRMHLKDLQEIESRLRALVAGRHAIVVDLSRLDSLFSMCLRTLLLCSQLVEIRGGRLVLLAPTDHIFAVLRASGVMSILNVYKDLSAAVAAVLIDSE